jgi:hypothetical protein
MFFNDLLKKFYSLPEMRFIKTPEIFSVLLCYDVREHIQLQRDFDKTVKEVYNLPFFIFFNIFFEFLFLCMENNANVEKYHELYGKKWKEERPIKFDLNKPLHSVDVDNYFFVVLCIRKIL